MNQQPITILDVSTGRRVTGKFVKRYGEGITIDDERDIRYYVTFNRIIGGYDPAPRPLTPGDNAAIW